MTGTPPRRAALSAVAALVRDLTGELGGAAVSVESAARRAASADWARMSPILAARLPAGLADVVVHPRTPEQIATAVRLAHRHRVPVTPRGKGTGNYGQAIPLRDGMVVDTSRCGRVLEVGDGWVRAEAGASFVAIEAAARSRGQEIAVMPSTVGSTIAGFLAGGSVGTGSIENGSIWDGYVRELDIATCTGTGDLVTVRGAECLPHLHAYGVTGVIARATVRLVPRRDWTALLASFADEPSALGAAHGLLRLHPLPRLLSLDEPGLVAAFPADPAMPTGRFSLRAVLDRSVQGAARALVTGHGGRVETVRPKGAAYLASLSFNHVTHRAQKAHPWLCHLEVGGDALTGNLDQVRSALPETLVHLDSLGPPSAPVFGGTLLCRFEGADALYAGVRRLQGLGVVVGDPHTWVLQRHLPEIRRAATLFDPGGLLNPGKLAPA